MRNKFIISVVVSLLFITFYSFTHRDREPYQHQLGIVSVFQNDARFLKEWIEYHRLVGVEHFWLYNNKSTDNFEKVLKPYIKKGIVTLVDWPYDVNNWHDWHLVQKLALHHGIKQAQGNTKWLAIIDSDEFIMPLESDSIIECLIPFEEVGAVCVNWQVFGTGGIKRIPDQQLMVERLTLRAEKSHWKNRYVKSIVRPERVDSVENAHCCALTDAFCNVDEEGKPIQGMKTKEVKCNRIRINHYWTRDEDFLETVKISRRGKVGSNFKRSLQTIDELNAVEDKEMDRFIPELRKRVFS